MSSLPVSPPVSCTELPIRYPTYPEPFRAPTADLLAFRQEVHAYLSEVLASVKRYEPIYPVVRALQHTLIDQITLVLPWFADLTLRELEVIVAEEEAAFLVWCAAEKAAWQQTDAARNATRRPRARGRRRRTVAAAAD